jgi:serine/threonine protein kinase
MTSEAVNKTFGENYICIKEIGRGGMGAVYLARDTKLQRQVALKVLTFDETMDQAARDEAVYNFKREAIAIANLNHENIVNVHDIGEQDDSHYIVMELIEGQPISKIIKLHPLPAEMVLSIAVQICNALSYVNRNGVIHRDIKPENILLLGKGLAKLTDFGIAKFADDIKSESNLDSIVGTILYMSPEQLRNPDEVDERADLYSLAVSLYEMLTGSLPFYGETISDVIMKILTEQPVPPSKIVPSLPKTVDDVILKALSKERNGRQASVAQFEKDLRSISEYKAFLEMRDLQFSQDRAGGSGGPAVPEKKAKLPDPAKGEAGAEVDLSWLDKLGFLMDEGEKSQDEKSNVLESFNYVVPVIQVTEIKNILSILKTVTNHNEMFSILNTFDGVKTVKQIIEDNLRSNIFDIFIDSSQKGLLPAKVAEVINNLSFVVNLPPALKSLLLVLRKTANPAEIINFLDYIDGEKDFNRILHGHYSEEKAEHLMGLLYECQQQDVIKIKIKEHPAKINVFLGDMLVAFSHVTGPQLKLALSKRDEQENKLLGEILVNLGFLTKEKLFDVLKLQLWYKKLFES